MPCVSVLMTIYNAGPYLRPAVTSLLAQSLGDFELIAVDDGSTDGSKAVIAALAAADPRIRVFDLPRNRGRTPALNLGLAEATGEFVAVLDADDLSRPRRLERQVAHLRERPRVVAVGTWCDFIDEAGALIDVFQPPVEPEAVREALIWDNPLAHSATMYRRAAAAGGYPADIVYAQDFALWQKLTAAGELANLPEWLTVLRRHQTNMTVQPAYALTRAREAMTLFEQAAGLGGYGSEARRRGRRALGGAESRYGMLLCRAGRMRDGLGHLLRAIRLNPCCGKDIPEFRRWTGINLVSRLCRPLRPALGRRLAGFTADQIRLETVLGGGR